MIERHSTEKAYAPAMDFQVMDDTLSADIKSSILMLDVDDTVPEHCVEIQ